MSLTVVVNLTHQAGATLELEFGVADQDGNPANITGAICRFVVARNPSAEHVLTTEGTSANVTATITDAVGGIYRMLAEAEETEGLSGTFDWETWVEDLSGGKSKPTKGVITFERGLLP